MKLPPLVNDLLGRLKQEGAHWRQRLAGQPTDVRALSQLLRPNLGPTPAPLRRVLEPVVAGVALLVLVSLLGVATFSFATLILVAGLVYAILTYVFGLELDFALGG